MRNRYGEFPVHVSNSPDRQVIGDRHTSPCKRNPVLVNHHAFEPDGLLDSSIKTGSLHTGSSCRTACSGKYSHGNGHRYFREKFFFQIKIHSTIL